MSTSSTIEKLYEGKVALSFDSVKHWYYVNGKYCPSVTSVLSQGLPQSPNGLMRWHTGLALDYVWEEMEPDKWSDPLYQSDLRTRAEDRPNQRLSGMADLGTLVHDYAEGFGLYEAGRRDEAPSLPESETARLCCEYFHDWWEEYVEEVLDTEYRCLSLEHWYCGTSDLDAVIKGVGRCVVDYKTSKSLYEKFAYQTMAYVIAREEEYSDIKYDGRVAVVFPRDGNRFMAGKAKDAEYDRRRWMNVLESFRQVKERKFWDAWEDMDKGGTK